MISHYWTERELNTSLVAETSERVFFVNFRIPDNNFFKKGLISNNNVWLVPRTNEKDISGNYFIREEISGNKGKDNSDNTCIPNMWNKYNLLPHEPKEALTHQSLEAETSERVLCVKLFRRIMFNLFPEQVKRDISVSICMDCILKKVGS